MHPYTHTYICVEVEDHGMQSLQLGQTQVFGLEMFYAEFLILKASATKRDTSKRKPFHHYGRL